MSRLWKGCVRVTEESHAWKARKRLSIDLPTCQRPRCIRGWSALSASDARREVSRGKNCPRPSAASAPLNCARRMRIFATGKKNNNRGNGAACRSRGRGDCVEWDSPRSWSPRCASWRCWIRRRHDSRIHRPILLPRLVSNFPPPGTSAEGATTTTFALLLSASGATWKRQRYALASSGIFAATRIARAARDKIVRQIGLVSCNVTFRESH